MRLGNFFALKGHSNGTTSAAYVLTMKWALLVREPCKVRMLMTPRLEMTQSKAKGPETLDLGVKAMPIPPRGSFI